MGDTNGLKWGVFHKWAQMGAQMGANIRVHLYIEICEHLWPIICGQASVDHTITRLYCNREVPKLRISPSFKLVALR
jgi:hypothetical protein